MTTVAAILVVIVASGMLVAYYVGFAAGRRDGYEAGRQDGKRERSLRAYAVGYDRGRHDRQAKQDESEEAEKEDADFSTIRYYLWPVLVSFIVVVIAGLFLAHGINR